MKTIAVVGVVVLATFGMGGGSWGAESEPPRTQACMGGGDPGIDALLAAWREALAAGDVDRVAELVSEDAEFWTQGRPPLHGREALREAFQPLLVQYDMDQEFQCQELIVADEWAFMRGMEVNHLRARDGSGERTVRQRAFSVMHRGPDGVWLIHRGMTHQPPEEAGG
ncbi:MAG TPA: SgcJ/EcaC family oxidoreductase, partial [Longimicrobiales bacterium]|nr:SgcJ/EcaC family oxidoreductase [Longimicrobiales bacterium]